MVAGNIPRPEFPRPDARRGDEWLCLNGEWAFEFDEENKGLKERWFIDPDFSRTITVPFVYQSKLSGIDDQSFIDTVWYSRQVKVPGKWLDGGRVLLHFGAVDYECQVFLNGAFVFHHEGGVTPFTIDITGHITGDNAGELLVVMVKDYPFSSEIPTGKQHRERKMRGIFYEKITGIWQTVWLEHVPDVYLTRAETFINADPFTGEIIARIRVSDQGSGFKVVEAQAFDGDDPISPVGYLTSFGRYGSSMLPLLQEVRVVVKPGDITPWTPENPKLYRLRFNLVDGDADDDADEEIIDHLDYTFGFRKVEIDGTRFLLNGKPVFLKQALYQGYWPDGLWTAPSDEKMRRDLELTLEMGFNGLRLHQIVVEPRFLHHADELGVLLWGEMANAFGHTREAKRRFADEWQVVVCRDRCHPSIVTWTPINESWGTGDLSKVENQEWLKSVYYLTKSLDPTRPVSENDGWEHVITDIATIHDYALPDEWAKHWPEDPGDLAEFLTNLEFGNRKFAPGCRSRGEPVSISEWGGWSMNLDALEGKSDKEEGWGYHGLMFKDFNEILDLYEKIIRLMAKRRSYIIGHCYTEFCDQYQEMNGILTFDRRPKGDLARLKAINDLL